ncbi:vWA domain-containing protein [Halofilum ochraceum]|uniref:vWA domain-containing protein n=1 Tax=Halofilum ochraceum TaxID=1611323 RepID=UPI00082F18D6|nr:VWA domain-containing protein [Halofilum ochraceum]
MPDDYTGAGGGRLAENVMHFARVLRTAGLPIGPDKVVDALRALQVAGVRRRDDFYWTLHAVFVDRREQRHLFDQAFQVFWRDPQLLDRMLQLLLPQAGGNAPEPEPPPARLAEALAAGQAPPAAEEDEEDETEVEASLTWSAEERLQTVDFESMTAAEQADARRAIARLKMPVKPLATRRTRPDPRGRQPDLRATMRQSLRQGGATIDLRHRARVQRTPPLVVLCDISGSMAQYSRMFLHFLHAVTNDRDRVHAFVFGTRLTNITRHLRVRDVDEALERTGRVVTDWAGGTRIGACLHEFNFRWARRLLGQGATVLLVTDGLDREAGEGVAEEMARLQRSARRLIWLNPLLRWSGFEAKAGGARAMLPWVDEFRPVHNIRSLVELADALGGQARAPRRQTA